MARITEDVLLSRFVVLILSFLLLFCLVKGCTSRGVENPVVDSGNFGLVSGYFTKMYLLLNLLVTELGSFFFQTMSHARQVAQMHPKNKCCMDQLHPAKKKTHCSVGSVPNRTCMDGSRPLDFCLGEEKNIRMRLMTIQSGQAGFVAENALVYCLHIRSLCHLAGKNLFHWIAKVLSNGWKHVRVHLTSAQELQIWFP